MIFQICIFVTILLYCIIISSPRDAQDDEEQRKFLQKWISERQK